jgi:hypothetical protein
LEHFKQKKHPFRFYSREQLYVYISSLTEPVACFSEPIIISPRAKLVTQQCQLYHIQLLMFKIKLECSKRSQGRLCWYYHSNPFLVNKFPLNKEVHSERSCCSEDTEQ